MVILGDVKKGFFFPKLLYYFLYIIKPLVLQRMLASLMAQWVKNLPAIQEKL